METRSVSPTIAPPSEAPKDEQESSHDQSTSESIVQSEEGLQEAPEKKQKFTKVTTTKATNRCSFSLFSYILIFISLNHT